MTTIRSTFSLTVADMIRNGSTVSDALHWVLNGIRDGSRPSTSDVLADLEDMGVFNPKPVKRRRRA